MKHLFSIFFLITFLSAISFNVDAIPAKKGLFTVADSGGNQLKVRLEGDEFFHQYFTDDGYPLILKNGNYYYCDFDWNGNIIESDIKAEEKSNRSEKARKYLLKIEKNTLEKRIRLRASKSPRRLSSPSSVGRIMKSAGEDTDKQPGPPFEKGYGLFEDLHFPAYGRQKAIVILVEYQDIKFDKSYNPKDYFTRMLNQDDFSDYGATGSAAQFFRENSNGAFEPEFDVYGPVLLSQKREFYGRNTSWGDDENPGDMVKEACDALDAIVDFTQYDRDNDGVVDNIFIFYAGRGESSGGPDTSVWPHSWNMDAAGYPNLYYDGVKVYKYGCSNEWEISDVTKLGRPDGVGTFIHEFSHVMGLPDLYATYYTNAFTPDSWSTLDYGPYNNDGMTPPNYGAFERYALGWIKPREIKEALSGTLQPIEENVCGIIRTSKPTEFFLLENRQQTGWDKFIPGHGMLIWHIDYDKDVWNENGVNNNMFHQYVDIEEADGIESEYTRDGDAFPGVSNVRSFTSSTNPALRMWTGEAIDLPVTEINETDNLITFNVLGGSDVKLQPVEAYEATDVTADTFTISWSSPSDNNDVILNVYTLEDGKKKYLKNFKDFNVGQKRSMVVTGTEPETTYYYTVAQTNGWQNSPESEEKNVTTTKYTINYFPVVALDASEIEENSFIANWESLQDATEYFISVYKKILGEPYIVTNGFDDGVGNLENWSVSSNITTYGMSSYAGEAIPSLRMPNGSSVSTPVYDDFIHDISFWHRGNSTGEGDYIDIYALTSYGEKLIKSIPVLNMAGGIVTEIADEIPDKTVQIRIQFIRHGDKGYLALDDVKLSHGHEVETKILNGYNALNVGDVLSYKIEGLEPNTLYLYNIYASDGIRNSLKSEEKEVTTKASSYVSHTSYKSSDLKISGLWVSSESNDEIIISNIFGAIVARGFRKLMLPGQGLYVISIPAKNHSIKTFIK